MIALRGVGSERRALEDRPDGKAVGLAGLKIEKSYLRRCTEAGRPGCADAAADVGDDFSQREQARAALASAPHRGPERADTRKHHLSGVGVAAEDEVGVVEALAVEEVGRMGEEDGEVDVGGGAVEGLGEVVETARGVANTDDQEPASADVEDTPLAAARRVEDL